MKKYEFKPYNPTFPDLFEKEKSRLAKFLSGDYQIEHIGSTAIPGLGGKGIIDIMIAVPKDQMTSISKQIQKANYIFRPLASVGHVTTQIFFLPVIYFRWALFKKIKNESKLKPSP